MFTMELEKNKRDLCEGDGLPCRAEHILQVLNAYRQSATLTDVVLQVDGSEFPSHRAILSASCLYFDAMFNREFRESHLSAVPVQGITALAMETVLNYLYEGKVALDRENVESVFCAADLLGVSVLRKACLSFLEECVDHSNCLGVLELARSFSITTLVSKSENLLYDGGFEEVCKHKEFLSQAKEWVVELLTSDQLHVEREEILLEAVLKWVHHNPSERKDDLKELLELVHLPLVDPDFFFNMVETDKLIRGCKGCRPLLLEAWRCQARNRPRRALGRAEMIVMISWNEIYPSITLEKLNPYTREWVPGATIPSQHLEVVAICELWNDIYVSGLWTKEEVEVVSQVWRYTSQLDHWVQVAPLPKARVCHSMAALHGKLYVVGGRHVDSYDKLLSVEVYSVYDNQWQTVAPLPRPESSPTMVSCSGKLYVFGGLSKCDWRDFNKVHCYDRQEDQWADVGTCPFYPNPISVVTHNSAIYLARAQHDQIYCYTPQTNDWSIVATLPVKRTWKLMVCEGKVFANSWQRLQVEPYWKNNVWTFCPKTRVLTEEEPMHHRFTFNDNQCRYVTITQRLPQFNTISV